MLAACVGVSDTYSPKVIPAATFTSSLCEQSRAGTHAIMPLAIIEDSRCPTGVHCIHAGTVRLQVKIQEGGHSRGKTLELKQPAALNHGWLHLVQVCPDKTDSTPIAPTAYRFTFAISADATPPGDVSCSSGGSPFDPSRTCRVGRRMAGSAQLAPSRGAIATPKRPFIQVCDLLTSRRSLG